MTVPDLYPDRALQPFEITTYDAAFNRTGWVGGYQQFTATPRFNEISTAEISLRIGHQSIQNLMGDGCRVVVNYDSAFLMSGRVRTLGATGPSKQGVVTFGVQSDFIILSRMLGFPNPTGPITAQGATTRVYTATGPAETVAKNLIRAALTRIGSTLIPITVAPDLGRGPTIRVDVRMDAIADKLFPAMTNAGVGVTVRQVGAGLVVDCYVPTVRTRVLTEESGALKSWTWTKEVQTATRAVVAGAGEGTDREYRYVVDTAAEARLNEWSELFVEARDIGGPYEDAIKNVTDTTATATKVAAEYDTIHRSWVVATNRKADATDRVADGQDAIDNAPATGAQHDRAVAAKARAQTALTGATSDLTAALADLTAKTTERDAANAAKTTAVALSLSLRTAYNADMEAAGYAAIAETANGGTISIVLQENPGTRYGRTLFVGDQVPVIVPPGVPLTQVVGSCTFTDGAGGLTVEPSLGIENPTALARTVAALKRLSRQVKSVITGR